MYFNVADQQLLPREKIRAAGVIHLTTEELLATVLGSGSAQASLQSVVSAVLPLLPHRPIHLEKLLAIPGVGIARACQILALLEFVDRLRPIGAPLIDSTDKVLELVSELRIAAREMVIGLYLDTRLQLLRREILAVGGLNEAILQPREIFGAITTQPIRYLILCHNHPSGIVEPSAADLTFTARVASAGDLLGIQLLDHVILGAQRHYSFRSAGILPRKKSLATEQDWHEEPGLPPAHSSVPAASRRISRISSSSTDKRSKRRKASSTRSPVKEATGR